MLAAICFGAFVAVANVELFASMLNRPPDYSEPDVLVVHALLAAAPFMVLGYRGSKRLIPWVTGILLTVWLWWRWLMDGVAYQRAPDGSGVNMGFAFLMLISPVFIGAVCVWIDEIIRQGARHGR
jgi:hypothetical protein